MNVKQIREILEYLAKKKDYEFVQLEFDEVEKGRRT